MYCTGPFSVFGYCIKLCCIALTVPYSIKSRLQRSHERLRFFMVSLWCQAKPPDLHTALQSLSPVLSPCENSIISGCPQKFLKIQRIHLFDLLISYRNRYRSFSIAAHPQQRTCSDHIISAIGSEKLESCSGFRAFLNFVQYKNGLIITIHKAMSTSC